MNCTANCAVFFAIFFFNVKLMVNFKCIFRRFIWKSQRCDPCFEPTTLCLRGHSSKNKQAFKINKQTQLITIKTFMYKVFNIIYKTSSSTFRPWLPSSTKILVPMNHTSLNSMGLFHSVTEFLWSSSSSIIIYKTLLLLLWLINNNNLQMYAIFLFNRYPGPGKWIKYSSQDLITDKPTNIGTGETK